MEKTENKENRYNALLLIITILIIAAVIIYTVFSKKQIEKYAAYTVQQNAEQISYEIDAYVNSALNSIQITSRLVTQSINDNTINDINSIIEPMLDQTPFNFIEYIEPDGTNKTDKGEQFNASDRMYYKEGIEGNTGIWVNFSPKYSQEYLLNFYTPLYYNNEIAGVLTGTLGSDTDILPIINKNFFGNKITGILCDENNRIIAATFEISDETYLDDVLNYLEISDDKKQIFYDYSDSVSSTFEFNNKNGKAVGCTSINERTGWRIIQIVPHESFKAITRQAMFNVYVLILFISLILFIFLFYNRISYKKKHEKIISEKDRIVKNYEQILTITASDTYKGIRCIDLETADSEYMYFEDNQIKRSDTGNWSEWIKKQKVNVHPDDYERICRFSDIDRLRSLKKGETYEENYRSARKNQSGYFRTYRTTLSITFIDGRKTAIMTTIDNTAAVVKEIEQKKWLAAASGIYISMYAFDLKNNTMENISCAEHIKKMVGNRKCNVSEILKDVMQKLTDEQYLDRMMEFIDFNTLDERMNGVNTITLEFLGTHSGWCRARFIAVDYDENNQLNHVLWVVENIDAEKRKSNRLLYLSETDLMTGIRNRGSGERKIKEFISLNHEGTFCLLDVDKFKSINDNFGHSVGDKVLIAIAGCMKSAFRDSDIVMRLGGDEFAIFADKVTDKAAAELLIIRFFDQIDSISIPELNNHKISVSLGAAIKHQNDNWDFETLYHNADSCTYKSKKISGNAYTFFDENN